MPDPEQDPLVTGTDPRIRIRTKMSRIRNLGARRNVPLFKRGSRIADTFRYGANKEGSYRQGLIFQLG